MKKDWTVVELLRYARHDWLNKIQLIKGNLEINNFGRVQEILKDIVIDAQQEAKLTNLQLPQFASLLFTYNWATNALRLEFEVISELKVDSDQIIHGTDEQITDWTEAFLQCLHSNVQPFYDNHLAITIDVEQKGIRFFFDFRGIITELDAIKRFLEEQSSIEKEVQELSEQELTLELYLPFNTKNGY